MTTMKALIMTALLAGLGRPFPAWAAPFADVPTEDPFPAEATDPGEPPASEEAVTDEPLPSNVLPPGFIGPPAPGQLTYEQYLAQKAAPGPDTTLNAAASANAPTPGTTASEDVAMAAVMGMMGGGIAGMMAGADAAYREKTAADNRAKRLADLTEKFADEGVPIDGLITYTKKDGKDLISINGSRPFDPKFPPRWAEEYMKGLRAQLDERVALAQKARKAADDEKAGQIASTRGKGRPPSETGSPASFTPSGQTRGGSDEDEEEDSCAKACRTDLSNTITNNQILARGGNSGPGSDPNGLGAPGLTGDFTQAKPGGKLDVAGGISLARAQKGSSESKGERALNSAVLTRIEDEDGWFLKFFDGWKSRGGEGGVELKPVCSAQTPNCRIEGGSEPVKPPSA